MRRVTNAHPGTSIRVPRCSSFCSRKSLRQTLTRLSPVQLKLTARRSSEAPKKRTIHPPSSERSRKLVGFSAHDRKAGFSVEMPP